jgi:hypothetical protein
MGLPPYFTKAINELQRPLEAVAQRDIFEDLEGFEPFKASLEVIIQGILEVIESWANSMV